MKEIKKTTARLVFEDEGYSFLKKINVASAYIKNSIKRGESIHLDDDVDIEMRGFGLLFLGNDDEYHAEGVAKRLEEISYLLQKSNIEDRIMWITALLKILYSPSRERNELCGFGSSGKSYPRMVTLNGRGTQLRVWNRLPASYNDSDDYFDSKFNSLLLHISGDAKEVSRYIPLFTKGKSAFYNNITKAVMYFGIRFWDSYLSWQQKRLASTQA